MAVVIASNLRKELSGDPLFDGVSFKVERRDRVALSGAKDLVQLEVELRRLEQLMGAGDHDPATIRRYGEAQARLEHAGGYDWREGPAPPLGGGGLPGHGPPPPPRGVSPG